MGGLYHSRILLTSGFLDLETGWRQLELQAGVHSISSGYLDFNPLDTRIQMRLTQLRPDDDLRFGIDYEFFEEEKRTSFVSSVNFDWHTKPGHKSGVFLHVGEDFSDCIENNPDMLAIPSFADIDINSDYTVELDRGRVRGSFKEGCEKADDGSDTWRSWKRSMDKIRKMSVKLTDSKFLGPEITLNDFFTLEYRLVHGKNVHNVLVLKWQGLYPFWLENLVQHASIFKRIKVKKC